MAIKVEEKYRGSTGRRIVIDWEAYDDLTGQIVDHGRTGFLHDPSPQEWKDKQAVIVAGVEVRLAEKAAADAYENQKAAYLGSQGLPDDDALVRKCVENNLDTDAVSEVIP